MVPPWIESDLVAKGNREGGKASSRGCRPTSTPLPVNARLYPHQVDYYCQRDGYWWQQQDEWAWAWAQMPETYIDPQRTVPGDWVTVQCESQGLYVAQKLKAACTLTWCKWYDCKLALRLEYQLEKNESEAAYQRKRVVAAALAAEATTEAKKQSWQDGQGETVGTQGLESLADDLSSSVGGVVATGAPDCKGKAPSRAGQGPLECLGQWQLGA